MASATLTEAITNSLDNHVSSSTIQEILVASSPAIDSFLSNPNSLTFRSQIPAQKQLVVEFEIFQNIELFLASLRPILIANDKRGLPQLSLEKLKLAINGDIQSLSDSELLSYSRLFIEGKYDVSRIVALVGGQVSKPRYYRTIAGASVNFLLSDNLKIKYLYLNIKFLFDRKFLFGRT